LLRTGAHRFLPELGKRAVRVIGSPYQSAIITNTTNLPHHDTESLMDNPPERSLEEDIDDKWPLEGYCYPSVFVHLNHLYRDMPRRGIYWQLSEHRDVFGVPAGRPVDSYARSIASPQE